MQIVTPFSNYIPGSSWLHRLDVRAKLVVVAVYVFAIFACDSWLGMAINLLLLLAACLTAMVPLNRMARGLVPVMVILVFTVAAHALMIEMPQATSQAQLLPMPTMSLSLEGTLTGAFFALRIVALVSATNLLTMVSPLVKISDSIASLLSPFARIGLPVNDIAMMFSIALRFIPLSAESAEKIKLALSARGMQFNQGGPIRRLRSFLPMLIPLIVALFRRADVLAEAMTSRCYDGLHRTRPRSKRFSANQLVITIAICAILIIFAVIF